MWVVRGRFQECSGRSPCLDKSTDWGVSMSRRIPYRYTCPDCGITTNLLDVMQLGGKVRPDFRARDGQDEPAVRVSRVLCWWCRLYHPPAEVEACMKIPERRAVTGNGTGSCSSALVAGPLKEFSELWDFLLGSALPDGKKRLPGSLSLKLQSGLLALSLADAETGQYCSLTGESLDDLLTAAELGLGDGSLPWRPSKFNQGKRTKN